MEAALALAECETGVHLPRDRAPGHSVEAAQALARSGVLEPSRRLSHAADLRFNREHPMVELATTTSAVTTIITVMSSIATADTAATGSTQLGITGCHFILLSSTARLSM